MNAGTVFHPGPHSRVVCPWMSLVPGDTVEVWSGELFRYSGWVDEVGDQGWLIWVIESSVGHRRLYLRGDGVTLSRV